MHLLTEHPSGFTRHGSQLQLLFHQPVLVIFSKYYFAGFFPSLFVKSTNSCHYQDAPNNWANGADSRRDEHMCTSRNTHRLLQCWQPASLYESQGQVSTSHRARHPLSQTLGEGSRCGHCWATAPSRDRSLDRADEGKQECKSRKGGKSSPLAQKSQKDTLKRRQGVLEGWGKMWSFVGCYVMHD